MERTKHYIITDEYGRILSGWSDGVFPDKDTAGAIMLTDQGGYQFQLEPSDEENPVLANPDGTHRYIYDPSLTPAYREATAEELAAERAGIEARKIPVVTAEQLTQQMLTDLELQGIEQGQAITDLELQSLEQGQAFTDFELRGGERRCHLKQSKRDI